MGQHFFCLSFCRPPLGPRRKQGDEGFVVRVGHKACMALKEIILKRGGDKHSVNVVQLLGCYSPLSTDSLS